MVSQVFLDDERADLEDVDCRSEDWENGVEDQGHHVIVPLSRNGGVGLHRVVVERGYEVTVGEEAGGRWDGWGRRLQMREPIVAMICGRRSLDGLENRKK